MDRDENEKMVNYLTWVEPHPDYKDIPIHQLKGMFDFSRGDTVPDLVIVRIEDDLENFHREDVVLAIKSNECVEKDEDIIFE